jgi:flagellar biosynthesis protein FlhF
MNVAEQTPASKELITEILQKIAKLNRQLPPTQEPSLLVKAPKLQPAAPAPAPPTRVSRPVASEFKNRREGKPSAKNKPEKRVEAKATPSSPSVAVLPSADSDFGIRVHQRMLDMGLLPAFARHVLEYLQTTEAGGQTGSAQEELLYLRALLRSWWRPLPSESASPQSHVFVGPAGSGKTTVLSKWLSQAVLLGGHSAKVWRLDGSTANTAEALTVYGEILGVPVGRAWTGEARADGLQFFDLPGVDWRNATAVKKLSQRIQELGNPIVHLVLNAAYDIPLLLNQVRVFGSCGVSDLIFTHLDEETRWGKLWNLVAGTELPIRFLSASQNVPGHFREATPELLLPS